MALRLMETFPPERAGNSHRNNAHHKVKSGGVRGRLVFLSIFLS